MALNPARNLVVLVLMGLLAFHSMECVVFASEALFVNRISDGEAMEYLCRQGLNKPEIRVTDNVRTVDEGGRRFIKILSRGSDGFVTEMILDPATLTPVSVKFMEDSGRVLSQTEVDGKTGRLLHAADKTSKVMKLDGPVFDRRTLLYVLRGFPFGARRSVDFQLFMPEFMLVKVVVTELGEQTIDVPAGRFEAYLLEMVPAGMPGLLARKFTTLFWFEKQPPHRFLKYEYRGITGNQAVVAGFLSS